jgi:hypothetical protein
MKPERRNLYRLLHVQPEAPTEVITAVYRCLMSKLKMHPDLGGNNELAARINDAYAVLSDPLKRKEYDAQRKSKPHARTAEQTREGKTGPRASPFSGTSFTDAFKSAFSASNEPEPHRAARSFSGRQCPLCEKAMPRFIALDTRCQHCDSPLSPIAHNLHGQRELVGRRVTSRIARSDSASIQLAAHHPFVQARLRDMSLSGIGLMTTEPVTSDSVVRVMTKDMDVVVHVVRVRKADGLYHVHARLLTGHFGKKSGVFVSASA